MTETIKHVINSRDINSRDITIRKMAPDTTERPNPHWVQCASSPSCCPVTPEDKRHEELPSID